MNRLKIVFFGTPEFAVPSLNTLIESGEDIKAVVTQPDRPKGRGKVLSSPPVKQLAEHRGIPVLQPGKLKDSGFLSRLKALSPDLFVVVAYGRILTKEILDMPKLGCINLHASLLPKYRGASPINWTIINGEDITGVTTMMIEEELDAGPILLKQVVQIDKKDTAGSLSERLSVIGAGLLIQTIRGIEDATIRPMPQEGEPSYAPVLKKADGRIDWNKGAIELFNFIRGMNPWPGSFSFLNGERIVILTADVMDGRGRPGCIAEVNKGRLIVGTGRELLSIISVKPEGKRSMDISAFLSGRDITEGMCFD